MLILVRFVIVVGAFLARLIAASRKPRGDGMYEGVKVVSRIHKGKHGQTGLTIGLALKSPVWLRLTEETTWDRLWKRLGLVNERQSGDAEFDDRVFVACDHPAFGDLLRRDAALRRLVLEALRDGFHRITLDGSWLLLESKKIKGDGWDRLPLVDAMRQRLRALAPVSPSRWAEQFLWRALVIEAVIWSLAGYAISAVLDLGSTNHQTLHLSPISTVWMGLAAGAALGVVSLVGVVRVMRGSSRGHRIIAESAVVLMLSTPAAGIQLVRDVNIRMNRPQARVIIQTRLEKAWTEQRRSKSSTYTVYFLRVRPTAESDALGMPQTLEVNGSVWRQFSRASSESPIAIEVGRGRLGLPFLLGFQSPTSP
jgi:hypothetical protein